MASPTNQRGFTLIELMLVVAVIGILASVALPAYTMYQNKARFAEAILAAGSARSAMEVAASAGRVSAVTDFDSSAVGIPPVTAQAATTHGVAVVDGVITITWQADGTNLAGETYTLTAGGFLPPIQWTAGGSCINSGFC
ncbi:MAG: type IVa pilus major pilin TapA [Pseudohongiellaceae bacterium]|jgi:type IV pilus assembly protein PilA